MITEQPATTSLYATRWKPLLSALGFSGFLWAVVALTVEPSQIGAHVLYAVLFAPFILFALYWVVTPIPILSVSATQLIYRPFPRPTVTINWKDVEHASASYWMRSRRMLTPATMFTLAVYMKPYVLAPGGGRQYRTISINLPTISKSSDELLQILRAYHDVQWLGK